MKSLYEKIKEYFVQGLVYFTAAWCVIALCMQLFFIVLHFSGNEDITRKVVDEIDVRIDGRFTNDPRNFWYKKQ
jgi:hypothetical protein